MSKAVSTTTTTGEAPTTEPATSNHTRRRLLAGSGLTTMLAAVELLSPRAPAAAAPLFIPASSPELRDAELITACTVFFRAEQDLYAAPDTASDEVHQALLDRYHDGYQAVLAMQAKTLIGAKSKARVVISGLQMQVPHFLGDTVEDCAEWHVLGTWRLLHELLVIGGAA